MFIPKLSPSGTKYETARSLDALSHINQVKDKLEKGEYQLEEYPCPCGADSDTELTTKDRAGIPNRVVMCQKCALIRTNPRMTADSFDKFYRDHYRRINCFAAADGALRSIHDEHRLDYRQQTIKGEHVLEGYRDIGATRMDKVLDIGCNLGGMLRPFKDRGAECYGVEIEPFARAYAKKKGVNMFASIDEALASGIKFDLIIMHDVVEHLLDFVGDMGKVKNMLRDQKSYLFIYTPGWFAQTPQSGIQLAHTHYFCASTLEYMMDMAGFAGRFLEEGIVSFWTMDDHAELRFLPPVDWVRYQKDHWENIDSRRLPPLRAVCKFSRKERYEYIRQNGRYGLPNFAELRDQYIGDGPLVLVGGGPSVDGQIDEIRRLKEEGAHLMVINRMYPWAMDNDLEPDFVVSLDATPGQERGFDNPNPEAIHLLATTTNPNIIDKLFGHHIYLWDAMDDVNVREIHRELGNTGEHLVVNGGGTVMVCAFSIGLILGFRDIHVFGFDCQYPNGPEKQTHAGGIVGKTVIDNAFFATIDGEQVITTSQFMEFTQQMLDMVWAGKSEEMLNSVKFYGDCLINRIWNGKFYDPEVLEGITTEPGHQLTPEEETLLKERIANG